MSGTAFGAFLRPGCKKDHGTGIGECLRDPPANVVGQQAHCHERAEPLDPADLPTQVLDVDKLYSLYFKSQAVVQPPRGDHVSEAGQPGGMTEVCRPCRPVEQYRPFSGQKKAEQHRVASHRRGQHQTDVRRRQVFQATGHHERSDEQSLVRDHARRVVGSRDALPVGQGTGDKSLRNRLSQNPERLFVGCGSEPFRWRRLRPLLLHQTLGQGHELPDRDGRWIGGEAESLLHGQRHFHPLQAVQAELVEEPLGTKFISRQRSAPLVGEDFGDGLPRLWANLIRDDLTYDPHGFGRELVAPRAEEEVVRNEGRPLRAVDIVPGFEPAVDCFTLQLRQLAAFERLDRDIDARRGMRNSRFAASQRSPSGNTARDTRGAPPFGRR